MFIKFRFIFVGLALITLDPILAQQTDTKPAKEIKTIKRLTTLLNRPKKDYRVKVRITSRSNNGDHDVVYLWASRDADPQGDVEHFKITGDEIETQELCLKCLPNGGIANCATESKSIIPDSKTVFPGSILPWEEALVGICGDWVIEKNPLFSPTNQATAEYQVSLSNAGLKTSWVNTLITMDEKSKNPLYFERINPLGDVFRKIKVLEIGSTGSWRGIRRAIIELPEGKVLMEVVRFRKGLKSQRNSTTKD